MTIEVSNDIAMSSDLYFRIKHKGSFKNKLICRFALNPAFLDGSNVLKLWRDDVDPDSIAKDSRFSENFAVEIHFRGLCGNRQSGGAGPCRPEREIKDLCGKCKQGMKGDIETSWIVIQEILKAHKYPKHEEGVQINFLSNQCDYEVSLLKAKELAENETKSTKSHSPTVNREAKSSLEKSKTQGARQIQTQGAGRMPESSDSGTDEEEEEEDTSIKQKPVDGGSLQATHHIRKQTSSLDRGDKSNSKRQQRGLTILKKVDYEVSSQSDDGDDQALTKEEFKQTILQQMGVTIPQDPHYEEDEEDSSPLDKIDQKQQMQRQAIKVIRGRPAKSTVHHDPQQLMAAIQGKQERGIGEEGEREEAQGKEQGF
ncbi:hypothetical protein FGO68_gene11783 [Halteria grandinella]|uniref:C2 tensin-type domain-containing protein n=1 Tax=Halteria grandinella TaxID=5974 RepID=A0A8J8NWV1_HALGN|nr:hypothetical protein FGO68_gene11783 [Halteria grandinella]